MNLCKFNAVCYPKSKTPCYLAKLSFYTVPARLGKPPMPNPFAYGARITDPARFVGRKAELQRVFSTLDSVHTGQLQSVSLVGPRRMGRSSLLYHIFQTYRSRLSSPTQFVCAYIDLTSGETSTESGLLQTILACLKDALPAAETQLHEKLTRAGKEKKITRGEFEMYIRTFQTIPGAPLYPLVCLDEFEQLTQHPDEFPNLLYDSFRSLMNGSHLAFVIASVNPIHEYADNTKLTSPFFNIFSDFVSLGEMEDDEARALVAWGENCDRPFTSDDCRHALKLAGKHPLKIQLAGSLVYGAKKNGVVNWHAVETGFEQRVENIFASERKKKWKPRGRTFVRGLGKIVHTLLNRPTNNDTTNLIMGLTALLLLVLIVSLAWFKLLMPLFNLLIHKNLAP